MPESNIERLSDAGEYAAQRLIARFHPPDTPVSEGWKNHRELRLRTFLGVLEHMALALQPRLTGGVWNGVVDGIETDTYSKDEKQLARQCLARVGELAAMLKDGAGSLEAKAPRPVASMRIAPRI